MTTVAEAAETVPERHYTHHEERGVTPHRSNPVVIHRELTTLDVHEGMNVVEFGTGSGYSGALLSQLVGPSGQVTSLDIDAYLARWAAVIHQGRGVRNVECHDSDGTAGFASRVPYDRMVAWCTPPLLPRAWVDQMVDGGIIVAPLPIAAVPNMTVVAKIVVREGQPEVESVATGGYIEATTSPKGDLDLPGRWVDWENRVPGPSWISIAWRGEDDHLRTGARTALDRLLKNAHTEPYGQGIDWPSWRTFAATRGDHRLTMAGLTPDMWAIGHTTTTTAAVIQQDGTILADAPDSPSLTVLRGWLTQWEEVGRPAPATYIPTLVRTGDSWDLRLSR
ncbi:protein-L-isoaspartate(D-aspartate) O-methyltransferase [Streptomyces sp. NBC_01433]|uniref:protein-L-isoaspartate O-methyltransferase family protein n=1 Tax=Streptomyces sp. NBC_01433 TaxID=2903864 RepID=UPI002250546D|nr:protein-L-isoaspartate(D-aspartate) O-methyltransferase [Streptomyces sp. NBC_01433]MCX4676731.1 protein-L-isoaspartate(D-aspartate) O-methyltransferase [Streptomyces sp. NBC_01433]